MHSGVSEVVVSFASLSCYAYIKGRDTTLPGVCNILHAYTQAIQTSASCLQVAGCLHASQAQSCSAALVACMTRLIRGVGVALARTDRRGQQAAGGPLLQASVICLSQIIDVTPASVWSSAWRQV